MITRSRHRTLLHTLLLIPLLLTTRPAHAAQTSEPITLTLERALAMAMDQNRDVTAADQDRRKADTQIGEARSGALPQLTLTGQYTRNIQKQVLFLAPNSPINPSNQTAKFELGSDNSYVAAATLSQALYSRKVGVALDIASTYRDFVEQGYRTTTSDVALAVKKAFYGALLAQRLVEANRQGLSVVQANVRNVEAQYRHGTAAEFDLLRAQVELANTEPLLISAENSLRLAMNAVKNLLALPLEQDLVLSGDLSVQDVGDTTLTQARTAALETNPMIQQLHLLENLQEMNIGIIESATLFPSLSLVGSYQWQTQDNTFHFKDYLWAQILNVGVQLSFPLFDGFRTSARAEEAEVEFAKAHITRLKAEEGLRLRIQAAELNMNEARKRIAGHEQSVAQARKAMRIAETRFKSGVGTQLELLDAQVAMTRTETMYAQAQYDYLVARAEWQHAVGETP